LLIPVVCREDVALVAITLRARPGKQGNRLEEFLIDNDAVNALYDAFTAFFILTGTVTNKVPCLHPKSAAALKARDMYIGGDSLGLGILLLLLGEAVGVRPSSSTVYAATGALTLRLDSVECREVGKLGTKVESAATAGVDVMYCPIQDDVPAGSHKGMLIKQVSVINKDEFCDFRMKVA
jgi:hypothetical protein